MVRIGAFLAALLLATVAIVLWWPQEPEIAREPIDGRLPPLAVPDHYLLRLTVFPEQPSFRGEVEINLQLHAATRQLYLHGRDLTVHKVEARRSGEDTVTGQYQQLTPQGLARIDFDEKLPAGFLTLVLHYDGLYTTTSEGLSRIQVGTDWYAFSQLHPIEARRVFPSFDEPSLKATFELEIVSWQQDVAVGNSLPSETRQLPNNLKVTRLNRTPRLPTYLLNISVGPFDVVNGPVIPANEVRNRPLTLRAITTRGKGVHTRFALQHTTAMLTAFEQYFAIPFPFDKLDLVAVPDSSSNVLENPGAINFLDELMLVDEQSPLPQRQNFIAHHAHALAHQWFGDLVTMPWWDDLWLNEGFAEWLGYRVAIESHPSYPLTLAMQQQLELAMQRDGLSPALRIRQPVSREQDVQSSFNTVVYDKAMGLMRMYERFLGSEQFRQGLRNYFARHAFGNAGATELFQSLGDAVANPVITASFDSFLNQPGLPQLQLRTQCLHDKLQIAVSQQPYQPAGTTASAQQWQLPVCLRPLRGTAQRCELLTSAEAQWQTDWPCSEPLIPNADGAGYYRWQVSAEHRQQLLQHLQQLTLTEALDVVANLNAAVRAGTLSLNEYWLAMPAIARYPNPAVLDAALSGWTYLLKQILLGEQRQRWQAALQRLLSSADLRRHASVERVQFRALLLADPQLRRELSEPHRSALQQFSSGQPLAETVNALALTIALDDDPTLLLTVRKQLQSEQRAQVRSVLVEALAQVNRLEVLPHLQLLLQSPHLRVHERWQLLRASLLNPALADSQWPWLQQQLPLLLPKLPDYRHSQLPELAQSLCDGAIWATVKTFIEAQQQELAIPATALATTDSHVRQCLSLRALLNPAPATSAATPRSPQQPVESP